MSMTGTFQYATGEMPRALPDFNVFHRYAANFPWRSHALWFISQMIRWGQITRPIDMRAVAEEVYRPQLFRQAAAELGLPCPGTDYKTEGKHAAGWKLYEGQASLPMGADRFLDGGVFDPSRLLDYLQGFGVQHMAVDPVQLAAMNRRGNADALQPSA
jgi:nitrate/nitrite transport system substrate-binding protein